MIDRQPFDEVAAGARGPDAGGDVPTWPGRDAAAVTEAADDRACSPAAHDLSLDESTPAPADADLRGEPLGAAPAPPAAADVGHAGTAEAPLDAEVAPEPTEATSPELPAASPADPPDAAVGEASSLESGAAGPAGSPASAAAGEPGTGNEDAGRGAAAGETLESSRLRSAVEAILFVVDRPTTVVELAQVLDTPPPAVHDTLAALQVELDGQARGFELREVAGGWRLYTRNEFAPYVERYILDGQQARLTQAALETLAVVAYRQPVTRARVSAIRGVSVDGVIRTLLSRGLIEECGSEPETGGLLYRTTLLFLEKLGLQSLEELPSLAPLLPELEAVEDVAPST